MIKKNTYFSNYFFICASLIITEFYFFINNSKAFIDRTYFLANTFSLFIFTIIIFFSLKFLFKKCQINKTLAFNIEILFLAFIYYKLVQIPFFLANTISLKEIIVIIIKKILSQEYYFLLPILKISLTFIFVYCLIYYIYCKNRNFLINLIISSSLIFLSIIIFNLISEKPKSVQIININDQNNSKNNRQVVWIVFDEYDPSYINNPQYNIQLPVMEKLYKNSFVHKQSYSPSNSTIASMSSIFMETKITNLEIKTINGLKIILSDDKKKKRVFNFQNTFLNKLKENKFDFRIISETVPYCYILGLRKNCKKNYSEFVNFFDSIKFIYFPIHYLESFIEIVKSRNVFDIDRLNNYGDSPYEIIFSKYLNYKKKDFENTIETNANLVFLHLYIPHVATGEKFSSSKFSHIRDFFRTDIENDDDEYLLNLKYTDLVVKEIIKKINSKKDKKILLILSSDHWRREFANYKPSPSLFIAKINNDNEKIFYEKKNMNIFIPKLILSFLKDNINSHRDIQRFFINEKIIKESDIYCSSNCKTN